MCTYIYPSCIKRLLKLYQHALSLQDEERDDVGGCGRCSVLNGCETLKHFITPAGDGNVYECLF